MNTNNLHHAVAVPADRRYAGLCVSAAGVLLFALLTMVGASIAIPLPGTPVPITLQTFFVLMAGLTLGPRLGTASMVFYLLLGATGYHVFALGSAGLPTMLGSTGGYMLGFVLAQPLLGWLSRRGTRRWPVIASAVIAGEAIIFAAGLVWLSLVMQTGLWRTFELGLWPFLPGTALKIALAIATGRLVAPAGRRLFDAA
ncbi:MAG: biotin transporter BioY [Phycisphaerae bacterium]|jgi:biotin transport system substrate-specific component